MRAVHCERLLAGALARASRNRTGLERKGMVKEETPPGGEGAQAGRLSRLANRETPPSRGRFVQYGGSCAQIL